MPGTAGPARPRTGRPWRLWAAVAALAGSAAVGTAQTPGGSNEPPGGRLRFVPPLGSTSPLPSVTVPNAAVSAVPMPSEGLPTPVGVVPTPSAPRLDAGLPLPGVPPVEATPETAGPIVNGELLPPTALETGAYPPDPAAASATPTVPVFGPRKPLPGSLADQVQRDYAARDTFRCCTWRDWTVTGFPTTLLWEPPLAILREPRLQALFSDLTNYRGSNTLDTSLGADVGLYRIEPIGSDLAVQLDIFGVAHTRLSPNDVMAQSYRFGLPVTFRRGPWHAKVGYEHTSDHLGDELIFHTGRQFTRYAKDEFVFGIGRYFYDCLRLYGQWSYAGYQDLPKAYNRNRYDLGFEYYDRKPTGFYGTPFLAFNSTWRGELNFVPITTTQVGWIWRNPELRLSEVRVFGTYYNGGSPYGQFFQDPRERWFALGIAGDY